MLTEHVHAVPESPVSLPERLLNAVAGLSVLSWGVLGLLRMFGEEGFSSVRLSIVFLHLAVGTCFLLRGRLVKSGSALSIAASLPSLLLCLIVFGLAPPPGEWPVAAQAVFAAGMLVAVAAVCALGRSFAVLPAVREVVVSGPFRIVRHPVYFGELLMVAGCLFAGPSPMMWGTAAAILPAIAARILAEERTLRAQRDYRDYTGRVRWRLLPGIW